MATHHHPQMKKKNEQKKANRKKCVGVVPPSSSHVAPEKNPKRHGNGKMLNAKRGKFARFPSDSEGEGVGSVGSSAVEVICVIRDHPRRKVK